MGRLDVKINDDVLLKLKQRCLIKNKSLRGLGKETETLIDEQLKKDI